MVSKFAGEKKPVERKESGAPLASIYTTLVTYNRTYLVRYIFGTNQRLEITEQTPNVTRPSRYFRTKELGLKNCRYAEKFFPPVP